jgi:iron complex outermembrane recepter protein
VDFFPADRTDKLYSGFLQDTVQLVPDKLSVTLGVKLEHNSYSGFEFQPTGRLLYRPRKQQTFWAAITRAVQTPSRLDQDINIAAFAGNATFLRLIGQKSYDAEPGVNYEGGYRQLLAKSFYFDLAVFHNSYHGLENVGNPALTVEANPPPPHVDFDLFFLNGAAGTSDGVEVSPNWKVCSWMQLAGSYSYLTLDFRSTAGVIGQSVAKNLNHSGPHHRVVIMPRIDLPGGFELDPTYRYEGAIAADFNHPAAAYQTLDTRLGWRVRKQFDISVVGQNLLQPHHLETSSSDPPIGIRRAVFVRLGWNR